MSKNIEKCIEKLKFIASLKNEIVRKKILKTIFDECLYKALNEIAINIAKGNLKLNNNQIKKYKIQIKKLSCKTNNKAKQKRLVTQSGGFLFGVLPAILATLTSLIVK